MGKVECRIEYGSKAIIIELWDWIVLVIVTLRATYAEPEQRSPNDLHNLRNRLISIGRCIGRERAIRRHVKKPRCDQLFRIGCIRMSVGRRCAGKLVPRKLLLD